MVAYYVSKIQNEEINEKTCKPWCVADVPTLWRKKVEAELNK